MDINNNNNLKPEDKLIISLLSLLNNHYSKSLILEMSLYSLNIDKHQRYRLKIKLNKLLNKI